MITNSFLNAVGVIGLLAAQSAPAVQRATTVQASGAGAPAGDPAIAAGFAAKLACSGVFVSGRDLDAVIISDIVSQIPPAKALTYRLDRAAGTVTAHAGPIERVARYRSGIGCALVLGDDRRVSSAAAPRRRSGTPTVPAVASAAMAAALDAAMADTADRRFQPRAIVVFQRGRVIAERYAPGFTAAMPMLGWSMSKSVNAVVAGLLVKDGLLKLDDSVRAPEWPPGDPRGRITARQLIQMTSGLSFAEEYSPAGDDSTKMLFASSDMASYAASRPLVAMPGTRWSYSSGSANILSRLIVTKLGGAAKAQAYMHARLFHPAGMKAVTFEEDASGIPVGASYVYATGRDWACFGELMRNRGRVGTRQVVASEWVDFVRTPAAADPSGNYGGGFWLNGRGDGADSRRFPDLPADSFYAQGHNGEFVGVFPSQDIVMVRLGWNTGGSLFDANTIFGTILAAATQDKRPAPSGPPACTAD